MDYNQFAESVKAAHPEYADRDNATLAKAMLTKFPAYADRVDTTGLGSTTVKLNPINQAGEHAQQVGYSGLDPNEQALIDSQFPSSQAASKGMSLDEVHAAMDARAQGSSPQQQASQLANNPKAVLQPQDVLYPSSSANTVQDVTGGYTAPLSGLLSMGHDIGSLPGRVISGAGAAAKSVGSDVLSNTFGKTDFDWGNTAANAKDAFVRSMADPIGGNFVSGILKDPLMMLPVGEVAGVGEKLAVNAAKKLAPETAAKITDYLAEHPNVVTQTVTNAIPAAATATGASGLEHGLYTGSDYREGNTNPLPITGSGLTGAATVVGPALLAGALRAGAIRNFPGQRPMETMATKQNIDQTMAPAEREMILREVTKNPFGDKSVTGYAQAAKNIRKSAQGDMDKAMQHADELWAAKTGNDPITSQEIPPMTVNDLVAMATQKSKQQSGLGFGTGEGSKFNAKAIQSFAQPVTDMYDVTNKPSPAWSKASEAYNNQLMKGVEQGRGIFEEPEAYYPQEQYREDLAKALGLIKENQSLTELPKKSSPLLDNAEKKYPYNEMLARLAQSAEPEVRTKENLSYPEHVGMSHQMAPVDVGPGGDRWITPSATIPIRSQLNKQIYNRSVSEGGNARRELSGNMKDVIREYLDKYGYSEELNRLNPHANEMYATSGKMGTYISKSPVRGQPMRWNLGIVSPYTYDGLINNYNKPAMQYLGYRGINKLLSPFAGSRSAPETEPKPKPEPKPKATAKK